MIHGGVRPRLQMAQLMYSGKSSSEGATPKIRTFEMDLRLRSFVVLSIHRLSPARPSLTVGADAAIFMFITGATRYLFKSRYLYDIDSVNFALALRRFDPAAHQPHPPGYFLYVCLGKLVTSFIHDANGALVAISIAASCGAAAMIYLLTRDWFGTKAARCAATLFVFSPLAWFHGIVALTYIPETFFSAMVGYLCWRGSFRAGAGVLGIAAGVRPSSLVFLAPLFFFSLWKESWRLRITGIAVLIFVVPAWFIPMVHASGGFAVWFSSLMSLWNSAAARQTGLNSWVASSVARLVTIVVIYLLCFGCAVILPFVARCPSLPSSRSKWVFACVWMAPGLLFFTFVFLRFVNSGYLLFLSPPVFAWLGLLASRAYNPGGRLLACACMAVNCLIFVRAPVYCSYHEVRKFETELTDVVASVPRVFSPKETVIVGFDSHFMGYRHAGYYLPDYVTVEYPAVRLASELRIFTMYHRNTTLPKGLPAGYKTFVIFPLPREGDEYLGYIEKIRRRFALSDLSDRASCGPTFISGPMSALPTLFHADP